MAALIVLLIEAESSFLLWGHFQNDLSELLLIYPQLQMNKSSQKLPFFPRAKLLGIEMIISWRGVGGEGVNILMIGGFTLKFGTGYIQNSLDIWQWSILSLLFVCMCFFWEWGKKRKTWIQGKMIKLYNKIALRHPRLRQERPLIRDLRKQDSKRELLDCSGRGPEGKRKCLASSTMKQGHAKENLTNRRTVYCFKKKTVN